MFSRRDRRRSHREWVLWAISSSENVRSPVLQRHLQYREEDFGKAVERLEGEEIRGFC